MCSSLATEIDAVQSTITYTLGANLENLTLLGTTAINGTGNTLNNIITGNSAANNLDGKAGADTLIGGLGNDTYLVDNVGDKVIETSTLATEIDTVQSTITYTLGANLENLTLLGTTAINGTGNTLNNIITGNSVANNLDGAAGTDTLTGGSGADTFIFRFGQSLVSAPDRITDLAIGIDKIDLLTTSGAAIIAPIPFTRAANSAATSLNSAVSQVFTDANGNVAGNQALAVNSAALVQVTATGIGGTYLVINDPTAGFQAANDLVINLTGYTGTLPALGNIAVNSFFA